MRLSFVIPAYNEENYIGKCLDSVCAQAAKYPGQVEIIAVNNASTDRTREIAAGYVGVKIVDEPRKGLVRARQAGFLASSGDLIANVDSDTVLTPGWLDRVFREFASNEKLVGLSGPFKYYDLPKRLTFWLPAFYFPSYLAYLVNRFVLRAGSMLQGGNFVVTRAGLEKIDGYDTSIEFYGEDTDIARRLHRVGDVKFTFKLPMYASGRRLAKEGLFTMGIRYGANYLWTMFFKKPRNKTYLDIRPQEKSGRLAYNPANRKRELTIALATVTTLGFILAIVGTAFYYVGTQAIFPTFTISAAKAETKKLELRASNGIVRISTKVKNGFKNTLRKLDTDD